MFFILAPLFLILITTLYLYLGCKIISPLQISKGKKIFLWALVILLVFSSLLALINFKLKFNSLIWKKIIWFSYLNFGFSTLLFVITLINNSSRFIFIKIKKISLRNKKNDPSNLNQISRRELFNNLANLGLTSLLSAYGLYEATKNPKLKKVKVPIVKLPPEFENFRIIQITDLHLNVTTDHNYLPQLVEKINSFNPDLIAITGDLVDGRAKNIKNVIKPLANLKSSFGTFFVTGNHEYYSGAKAWIKEIKNLGIQVLDNKTVKIKKGQSDLLIAGVNDYSSRRFYPHNVSDPRLLVKDAPKNQVKILLAHQPRSIYKASQAGYDLQISGHTHGGQYFPGMFLVYLQQPYLSGLHQHQNTWIYVSRGTGYWGPPLRIGAPAEISELTLTRKSHKHIIEGIDS